MKYSKLTDRLAELVESEHVCGCDSDTCEVNVSFRYGFALWAIYLFDSSGASSPQFNRLYRQLPKRFLKDAEAERKMLVESVAHDWCPHCNAVVWHDGSHGDEIFCDSCARSFKRQNEEAV